MQPIRQKINISDIYLDTENFRIEESDSQDETFENMLENQKSNLINLAEDIVLHGLSPAEQLMVIPHPEEAGKYIVCEGNRRITALKFLEDPSKVPNPDFFKYFKDLSEKFSKTKITQVDCVIFPNKNSALHWIDRKHQRLEGRGLNQWGAEANGRREEYVSGKIRPSKIVLSHLINNNLLSKDLEKSIRRRTTNLDRVFQMPYVKDRLGIVLNRRDGLINFEKTSESKGNELLLKMVEHLADKEFSVRRIIERDQRIIFIDQFADFLESQLSSAPNNEEKEIKSSNPKNQDAEVNIPNDQEKKSNINSDIHLETRNIPDDSSNSRPSYPKIKDSLSRNTLALTQPQHTLKINDSRLARMYREARRIDPSYYTNASSLLLRVFLELSVDHYLETKKLAIPEFHLNKGRKRWTDIGISLQEKVQTVLDDLDPSKKEHELKMARKGLSGDMLHSIGSLHDLIHNRFGEQSDRELKQAWERWQPFWKRLYDAI